MRAWPDVSPFNCMFHMRIRWFECYQGNIHCECVSYFLNKLICSEHTFCQRDKSQIIVSQFCKKCVKKEKSINRTIDATAAAAANDDVDSNKTISE